MSSGPTAPLLGATTEGYTNYASCRQDARNDAERVQVGDEDRNQPHNPLLCTSCSSGLCEECKRVLQALIQRDQENAEMYEISSFKLALKRMPALLITMVLELSGGIVINMFSKTLEKFILLSSFMPIISALSGNLGLQTSSNITRGLATGNVSHARFGSEVKKEVLTGVVCSLTIAILLGCTGTIWVQLSDQDAEVEFRDEIRLYPLVFGGVVCLGTFLSMIISSTNGTLTPFIAHKCHLDPAKIAGPLETAFQDIAGAGFLLGISYVILTPLLPVAPTPTPTPLA